VKIVCPNCGFEFDTDRATSYNISLCPKCGAPFVQDGLGVAWA